MPISADEEQELKVRQMRADIGLKERQSFWETPRNLVIIISTLVGLTAVVAGYMGYKTGREPSGTSVIINFPPGTTIQVPPAPAPAR